MHRLSKFLASVSLLSSILAACILYYPIQSLGYEGSIFVGSVAVMLAIGAGLLSLILAAILLATNKLPKPITAAAMSIASIALAFAYIWSI